MTKICDDRLDNKIFNNKLRLNTFNLFKNELYLTTFLWGGHNTPMQFNVTFPNASMSVKG